MAREENLNKTLYKIELITLKALPIVIAFCYFLNTLFAYFDIDLVFLSYVAGLSALPLIFLYISSYVFKFCEYHRIYLHYITSNELITCVDYYYPMPLNDRALLTHYLLLFIITIFISTFLYVRRYKNSTKINT